MNRPGIHVIIVMACVMLAIVGSGVFYVGRKIFRWLCLILPGVNSKLFIIIPAIIVLSFVLAFLPLDPNIKKIFTWFNWLLMGLFVYLLLFFLLSDAVLLIGKLIKIIPTPTPQSFIITVGWIVIVAVTGMTTYGVYNANQIKQASYTVQIEKETSLENLNIALVTDIHLGHLNDEKWLARIVDKINALDPDIVCIAGDVFNDNFNAISNPNKAAQSLQSIQSKYGVYACMGNHNGGSTFDDMLDFLEISNVTVLQDEYVVIEDKFIILGRTESSPIGSQGEERKELTYVLEGMDMGLPVIIMDHNPANIGEYGNEIDMILSGHTHKGQMFPANIVTNLMYEVDYGHYQKDASSPHVIVTSGAGVWGPPLRIGTNNEIVSILAEFN